MKRVSGPPDMIDHVRFMGRQHFARLRIGQRLYPLFEQFNLVAKPDFRKSPTTVEFFYFFFKHVAIRSLLDCSPERSDQGVLMRPYAGVNELAGYPAKFTIERILVAFTNDVKMQHWALCPSINQFGLQVLCHRVYRR